MTIYAAKALQFNPLTKNIMNSKAWSIIYHLTLKS